MAGTVGFKNGDLVTKNITFDYTTFPQPGQPGIINADGQLLIGSIASFPNIAMSAGTLIGFNGINVSYVFPNLRIGPSTPLTDYHTARFIVSAGPASDGANYTTLATAYAAAVATGLPQTVFVQPGTYTENITLSANVNICAFACDATTPNVTILGKLTATFAGTCSLSGLCLKTNADFCLAVTGNSATVLNLIGCNIIADNNVAISMTSSSGASKIYNLNGKGNINTTGISYFTHSGNGSLRFDGGVYENDGVSVTAATLSGGTGSVGIRNCFWACPITTTSTSNLVLDICEFVGAIIHNSTGSSSSIYNSEINGGTASALSVGAGGTISISHTVVNSTNTNAITGAGEIKFGVLSFVGSSSTINTTTQTPLQTAIRVKHITAPAGYPYTTLIPDEVILVDTSAARTINLIASPPTGLTYCIKDNVGTAAAFNITITPAAGLIDGLASQTISSNWGSMTVTYNGTGWRIL